MLVQHRQSSCYSYSLWWW